MCVLFFSFRLYPATDDHISETETSIINIAWYYSIQETIFWYTTRNIVSDHYFQRYRPLIAILCYQYTYPPRFQEQMKLKQKLGYLCQQISLQKPQWVFEINIIIINMMQQTGYISYSFFGSRDQCWACTSRHRIPGVIAPMF